MEAQAWQRCGVGKGPEQAHTLCPGPAPSAGRSCAPRRVSTGLWSGWDKGEGPVGVQAHTHRWGWGADPRARSGCGGPSDQEPASPLQSLYTRPSIPNTRPQPSGPLGPCSLTIFSQAGEKIACQLGRGLPATGSRVGAPAPLTAVLGCCPPRPPPPQGCPCPAVPLLFLAQPRTEAPPSSQAPTSQAPACS